MKDLELLKRTGASQADAEQSEIDPAEVAERAARLIDPDLRDGFAFAGLELLARQICNDTCHPLEETLQRRYAVIRGQREVWVRLDELAAREVSALILRFGDKARENADHAARLRAFFRESRFDEPKLF